MKMTIKTEKKEVMCEYLKNDKLYDLEAIIKNDASITKVSVLVRINYDTFIAFDSAFFRMDSIKITK